MPAVHDPSGLVSDGLYDVSSETEGSGGTSDSRSSDSLRCSDLSSPHRLVLPGSCPHAAYHAQQRAAATRTTFELDGRPLPDIDHRYYDKNHKPEPANEPSRDFRDCCKSVENFRTVLTKNHYFHAIIAALIVVDIIVVVIQLILDLEIVRKNHCVHDHDCPEIGVYKVNVTGEVHTTFNCSYDPLYTKCLYKAGALGCYDQHARADANPADVLHYMSISVLAIFVLETIARLVALQREFFRRKLEVFDGVVVTVAFILDLTVVHGAAVALLMLVRLWRVTRIVNGIAIAMESREEAIRSSLRRKNHVAAQELLRKRETVRLLRMELLEWRKGAALVTYVLSGGMMLDIDETPELHLDRPPSIQSESFSEPVPMATRPVSQ